MPLSDLRAAARLATDATIGVSRIAEGVHQSVWSTLGVGRPDGRTRGLTGFVYRQVRGAARLTGAGADTALGRLFPERPDAPETARRAAWVAALNGVLGDHLAATDNPLATPMALRYRGAALAEHGPLAVPDATGRPVLFLHGLCMNERQWRPKPGTSGVDYAALLARELGVTPLHLRYNSGLSVSENGRRLAHLLAGALERWPVPLDRLDVVAHSMGGLLIRSALHYARQEGLSWPDRLGAVVFLGTPHHGSPLERAGNGVDRLLGATRYSAPFAALGQLRSAGITDLRYGRVLEAPPGSRFQPRPDTRPPLPLPDGVRCYAVAATLAGRPDALADETLGDGLVPLSSALGRHPDSAREVRFADEHTLTLYGTGHFTLLHHPEVARRLVRWLA